MAKADYGQFVSRGKRLPPPDPGNSSADQKTPASKRAAIYRANKAKAERAKKFAKPGTKVGIDQYNRYSYTTKGPRTAQPPKMRRLRGAGPPRTV